VTVEVEKIPEKETRDFKRNLQKLQPIAIPLDRQQKYLKGSCSQTAQSSLQERAAVRT
jgi:hypothetical protein